MFKATMEEVHRKKTEQNVNLEERFFMIGDFSDASSSVLHQVEFFLSSCETVSLPLMSDLLCQINARIIITDLQEK